MVHNPVFVRCKCLSDMAKILELQLGKKLRNFLYERTSQVSYKKACIILSDFFLSHTLLGPATDIFLFSEIRVIFYKKLVYKKLGQQRPKF